MFVHPRSSAILTLAVIAFGVVYTCGQNAAESAKQDAYDALLAKLKGGDTKVDFRALRIAYSETKDAAGSGTDHEARRPMNAAAQQQRCDEANRLADEILKTTYLSPDAHIAKSVCYLALGDTEKAAFHKAIYLGLVNSILVKGDGITPETAYSVISVEEEYAVMRALGFTVWAQAQFGQGGHSFEILSATNQKTNQSLKFYFNIDIPTSIERRKTSK